MKKRILVAVCVIFMLALPGCAMRTVNEMYSPPRHSSVYSNLQRAIEQAMQSMEYASPVTGENRQSIQMRDITGDGLEECLVFAKMPADKMLYILVFSQDDTGDYRLINRMECNGTGFEQVEYADMDGKPGAEIVVGRRLNDQIMAIASVFSLSDGESEQIMSTIYSKFMVLDMDADGISDLFILREGEGARRNASAMVYSYKNQEVIRSREAELSADAASVRRMTASKLLGGETAVYIASDFGENALVTDVFVMKDGAFTNLTFSSDPEVSVQTLRNFYVFSEDINNDGVLDLPSLVTMKSISKDGTADEQYLIRWYNLDISGKENTALYTYHNYANGWYIVLNEKYAAYFAVEQNARSYVFYLWDETYSVASPVFTVFTFTGKDRDAQAGELNRFPLYLGENVVYAADMGMISSEYGFTQESLQKNFHLMNQTWKKG